MFRLGVVVMLAGAAVGGKDDGEITASSPHCLRDAGLYGSVLGEWHCSASIQVGGACISKGRGELILGGGGCEVIVLACRLVEA